MLRRWAGCVVVFRVRRGSAGVAPEAGERHRHLRHQSPARAQIHRSHDHRERIVSTTPQRHGRVCAQSGNDSSSHHCSKQIKSLNVNWIKVCGSLFLSNKNTKKVIVIFISKSWEINSELWEIVRIAICKLGILWEIKSEFESYKLGILWKIKSELWEVKSTLWEINLEVAITFLFQGRRLELKTK